VRRGGLLRFDRSEIPKAGHPQDSVDEPEPSQLARKVAHTTEALTHRDNHATTVLAELRALGVDAQLGIHAFNHRLR